MMVAFGMTVLANCLTMSLYVAENKTFWHVLGSCLGGGTGETEYKKKELNKSVKHLTLETCSPPLLLQYLDDLILLYPQVDHEISFVQQKHFDIMQVNDSFHHPVQDTVQYCPRCANDSVLFVCHTSRKHCV